MVRGSLQTRHRGGVRRNGQHLSGPFLLDHFSQTTDEDIKALYAFFMSRDPVEAKVPPNELPFPINIRLVLAGWKLLFFRPARFVAELLAGDEGLWNRGRYLVEGLGHCGACHTPRNLRGAEEESRTFEGGEIEGWRAYALGAASQSPIPWDEVSLTQYLTEGFHPLHGVARKSMAVVTGNLRCPAAGRRRHGPLSRLPLQISIHVGKKPQRIRVGRAPLLNQQAHRRRRRPPPRTPDLASIRQPVLPAMKGGARSRLAPSTFRSRLQLEARARRTSSTSCSMACRRRTGLQARSCRALPAC